MITRLNKQASVILAYQAVVAVGAVFLFFTGLDIYLYVSGLIPFPPLLFIVGFGILSIPILLSRNACFPSLLIGWSTLFILISALSLIGLFNWHINYIVAFQELRIRILSIVFLFLMVVIFSKYKFIQVWARRAILISVLIAVINNIYDFFHPLIFSSLNVGRPAGFYINPNQAGAALVLGLIFSIGILKPRYRVPFMLIVGVGVLLTLSRGALLGLIIVGLLLLKMEIISWRQLLRLGIGLGLIALAVAFYKGNLLTTLSDTNIFYNYGLSSRFEWLNDPTKMDSSDSLRFRVIQLAWNLFSQHPLLGQGIGSTLDWSESVSTHNIYLYFMADHGIVGAFIVPTLLLSVTRRARGEAKRIGFLFSAFILIWGLFSHNVLGERYILILFSLIAAMTITSRQEEPRAINTEEL